MPQTVVNTDRVWRPMKIGGGGYVTKIDIADDGSLLISTDTYGGYIRNPGDPQWTQLWTAYTAPAGLVGFARGGGFYEAKFVHDESDVIWMSRAGKPFRSTDRGVTWVEKSTGFPTSGIQMDPNAQTNVSRLAGHFMAIDPVNPDVVYLGTGWNVYRTLDGGDNWAICSGVSDATYQWPGVTGLFIDQSSANAGSGVTRKSVVMFHSYGRGWYRSTDGGDTFTLAFGTGDGGPGYPNNPAGVQPYVWDAVCNDNGVVLATDQEDVWRYSGGVWTNIGCTRAWYVLFDPFDQNRAIAVHDGGQLAECLDVTAATPVWSAYVNGTNIKDGLDIPWIARTNVSGVANEESYMSAGRAQLSPVEQNRIYFTQGCGVWYADIPPGFTTVPWKNYTTGIENLVGQQIRKFAGNPKIYAVCWDRALYISGNPEAYADTTRTPIDPLNTGGLRWGSGVNVPDDNPDLVLALVTYGGEFCRCGKSFDRGWTWEALGLPPIFLNRIRGFDCIETTSGSPTVGISIAAHGYSVGSWVTFIKAQDVGGVSLLGKRYQVASVVNANKFTITYESNASSSVAAGGKNVHVTNRNGSNMFSTQNGSGIVTATIPSDTSALIPTGYVSFYNASTVGGLNVNGRQRILTVAGAVITFAPGGTANATVVGGGGSNVGVDVEWKGGEVPPATQITASTEDNYIIVGGGGRIAPHYTLDGGVTWAPCVFPTELDEALWSWAYYQMRNIIDSEPDNPGTFYAYHYAGGTYKSTDGGQTFTLQSSTLFDNGNWHATLVCVPGHPGHLFAASGSIGSPAYATVEGYARFSTDGGVTWNILGVETLGGSPNNEIREVNYITFSAVKPGSSYPTIWIEAWVNGEFGRFYCTDADPLTSGKWTWNKVEGYPMGWMDFTTSMCGDPEVWHTCYSSAGGSGYYYTTLNDLTKRTFEITT